MLTSKRLFISFWIIAILCLVFLQFFIACSDDDDDNNDNNNNNDDDNQEFTPTITITPTFTPTFTRTRTPTITPTFTPTGNAPELLYPIDEVEISDYYIEFDWTDAPGSTQYWFALWIWYPAGASGEWISIWNNLYQNVDESRLVINI